MKKDNFIQFFLSSLKELDTVYNISLLDISLKYRYFKKRYLNYEKIVKYLDIILVTHPLIFNQNIKKNKNTFLF